MRTLFATTLGLALILGAADSASAHPGRTDASGCHTCRTDCPSWGLSHGEYHCHNAKASPQPEEPIKSHYGEGGTGYTEPAPEYKVPVQQPYSADIIQSVPVEDLIKSVVLAEKISYYQNSHGFREKLVKKLVQKYGQNYWIGFYIYTLLPDIR